MYIDPPSPPTQLCWNVSFFSSLAYLNTNKITPNMPSPLYVNILRIIISALQQILAALERFQLDEDYLAHQPPAPESLPGDSTIHTPTHTERSQTWTRVTTGASLRFPSPSQKPTAAGAAPAFTPQGAQELPICIFCRNHVYDRDTPHCLYHLRRHELDERGLPSPQTPKERAARRH